jgi:Flp pilus assembly protein TadD
MTLNVRSRPIAALAAILATAALCGCASAPSRSTPDKASELYDGQPDTVFATEFPPGSAPEAALRGDLALRKGEVDRALYFYVEAVGIDPADRNTLAKIAWIHRGRRAYPLALEAYRRILALDPHDAGALEGAGLTLIDLRRFDEAGGLLERAVGQDPKRWRAHEGLGVLADLEHGPGWAIEARRHYEDALAIAPDAPSVHNNFGYSLYMAGDLVGAARSFERAVEIDPHHERAWRNLALVRVREARYRDALEALRRVENEPSALNDVGYLAMLEGHYDAAEGFLEAAAEASPTYYRMAYENLDRVRALRSQQAPAAGLSAHN